MKDKMKLGAQKWNRMVQLLNKFEEANININAMQNTLTNQEWALILASGVETWVDGTVFWLVYADHKYLGLLTPRVKLGHRALGSPGESSLVGERWGMHLPMTTGFNWREMRQPPHNAEWLELRSLPIPQHSQPLLSMHLLDQMAMSWMPTEC